jgi:hypothetical protein
MYDCGTCGLKAAWGALDTDGQQAWELFGRVYSRFTADSKTAAVVLDRLTQGWTKEAFDDLIARFTLVHGLLYPVKKQIREDDE